MTQEQSAASPPANVLLITKGHPFKKEPFFAVFDANPAIRWTHVEQPAAQLFFTPEHAAPYDAFVLDDMPGIAFRASQPPLSPEPTEQFKRGVAALLQRGHGFVFLHHAIAWVTSPEARAWAAE